MLPEARCRSVRAGSYSGSMAIEPWQPGTGYPSAAQCRAGAAPPAWLDRAARAGDTGVRVRFSVSALPSDPESLYPHCPTKVALF